MFTKVYHLYKTNSYLPISLKLAEGASENTDPLVKPLVKENMTDARVYVRKYKPAAEDVHWAQKGVVASVVNGEAISVVYNRIVDTGFQELSIIPLGADKVLVQSTTDADVMATLDGAKDFFKLLFSNWARWNKEVVPSQRGAWVRLYGIPLHAWNENFFKLCAFDCGWYLRADSGSVERDGLDYACILIATSALEIVMTEEKLLVEGELIEVKIVEEWGLALGEDACFFEDEAEPESYHSDNEAAELEEDESIAVSKNLEGMTKQTQRVNQNKHVTHLIEAEKTLSFTSSTRVSHEVPINPSEDLIRASATQEKEYVDMISLSDGPTEANPEKDKDKPRFGKNLRVKPSMVAKLQPSKRTKSCPSGAHRSGVSGPWSLTWMQEHDHGNAGVIFSTLKKEKKMVRPGPVLDRREVLQILKKHNRRRGERRTGSNRSCDVKRPSHTEEVSSSVSVNNDWKYWVVMQGNEKMAAVDVWGIGNAIGVKLHSDNSNRFSALTRTRKGKQAPAEATRGVSDGL
ncbi:hypothetical protein TSUD_397510 [Trifolium subterraneum]|uniref:Uncharacterized protein n=1 Tax=Trifolium subterraneum TaxID=3900 RepID=A0A2Z6NVV2_TRISU|nr:hypothetical protein TSUD_397510 [Trifolium subterraneum]